MTHRSRIISAALLAAMLMAGAAVAQEHEQHNAPPPATTPGQQSTPQTGMCPMCTGMGMNMGATTAPAPGGEACPHMQAGQLADQLLTSLAALEKEQASATLKSKIAAHGALLKQLKQVTSQQCPMMEHMGTGGMMGGGMMGGMGGMHHPAPAK